MSASIQEGAIPAGAPQKNRARKATSFPAPAGPGEKEIADNLAKGMVWTNPTTKVYHKSGEFYGRTKNGLFMTETDAVRRYYRPSPDVVRTRGA